MIKLYTIGHSNHGLDQFIRLLEENGIMFTQSCFIRLTGIHTFPDYLAGKTFADFAPKDK